MITCLIAYGLDNGNKAADSDIQVTNSAQQSKKIMIKRIMCSLLLSQKRLQNRMIVRQDRLFQEQ